MHADISQGDARLLRAGLRLQSDASAQVKLGRLKLIGLKLRAVEPAVERPGKGRAGAAARGGGVEISALNANIARAKRTRLNLPGARQALERGEDIVDRQRNRGVAARFDGDKLRLRRRRIKSARVEVRAKLK